MRSISQLTLAASLLLLAPACLIADSGEEQGYTECGDFLAAGAFESNYCQPGTHCVDPTFSECAEGCLSNENCAEDQRCVKRDGTNVGTCQNTGKQPASNPRDGKPGGEVSAGVTPCGSFGDEEIMCQPGQFCEDARFSRCELGCLSDLNCTDSQRCVKAAGADVGSCQ